MAKTDKLLAKAKNSPQNISFAELQTLADAYGLPLKQGKGGGSHYIQRLPDGIKIPYLDTVTEYYGSMLNV